MARLLLVEDPRLEAIYQEAVRRYEADLLLAF